jgi:hypothetical protein
MKMKLTTWTWLTIGAALIPMILPGAPPAEAADKTLSLCRGLAKTDYKSDRLRCLSLAKSGQSGTTLAAEKTLDVCDNGDGTCTYSGAIGVSNTGAIATVGCKVNDFVECKAASGPTWNQLGQAITNGSCDPTNSLGAGGEIPPNTSAPGAVQTYSFTGPCCPTTARNRAKVTITNHSGQLGKAFGPEPKATFLGTVEPCEECECTRTRGYWQTHDGDPNPNAWGSPITPTTTWLNTAFGATWGAVLETIPAGNPYYIVAAQYIAAVLNHQNGTCEPTSGSPSQIFGPGGIVDQLTNWLTTPTCFTPSTCGTQLAQAQILDAYNNGVYPGAPHCED